MEEFHDRLKRKKVEVHDEDVRMNAYYICMSSLQKAVRRSKLREALVAARVIWEIDAGGCYRRLFWILFEDCGRATGVLEEFDRLTTGATSKQYKNWGFISNLVKLMVEGRKAHETHFAGWFAKWGRFDLIPPGEVAEKVKRAQETENLEEGLQTEAGRRIARFCTWTKKRYGIDLDMVVGVPAWYEYDKECADPTNCLIQPITKDEFPGADTTVGPLLISCVDSHTRVGKMCLKIFYKKNMDFLDKFEINDSGSWSQIHWCWLGSTYARRVADFKYDPKLVFFAVHKPQIVHPDVYEWFHEKVEDFLKICRWGLENKCAEACERIRTVEEEREWQLVS